MDICQGSPKYPCPRTALTPTRGDTTKKTLLSPEMRPDNYNKRNFKVSYQRSFASVSNYDRERLDGEYRNGVKDFLLSKEWDYFYTVTFRYPQRNPVKACDMVGSRLRAPHNNLVFAAAEPHPDNPSLYHVHGLFANNPDWTDQMLSPLETWRDLFASFGRSRVEVINTPEAVSTYCAKYITKDLSWWNVY